MSACHGCSWQLSEHEEFHGVCWSWLVLAYWSWWLTTLKLYNRVLNHLSFEIVRDEGVYAKGVTNHHKAVSAPQRHHLPHTAPPSCLFWWNTLPCPSDNSKVIWDWLDACIQMDLPEPVSHPPLPVSYQGPDEHAFVVVVVIVVVVWAVLHPASLPPSSYHYHDIFLLLLLLLLFTLLSSSFSPCSPFLLCTSAGPLIKESCRHLVSKRRKEFLCSEIEWEFTGSNTINLEVLWCI